VDAAEDTDIILVAHEEKDIDIMAAYRAIFAYACVESFGWLEDVIQHPGYLWFTVPIKVTNSNGHKSINSFTNHQLQ